MNQLAQLKALAAKLRSTGQVKITSVKDPNVDLYVHRFAYSTDGNVPAYWPITGAADLEFKYDEHDDTWDCTGSMFGIAPRANNPKVFFSAVYQGTRTREQTLRGFLQQAGQVAERYRGDFNQMCYRLGVEMAAVGMMVRHETYYEWVPTSDPGVKVYFMPDPEPPGYFELPRVFIGFSPEPKLQRWELTQNNLMVIREELKTYAHQAKEYCGALSACFT